MKVAKCLLVVLFGVALFGCIQTNAIAQDPQGSAQSGELTWSFDEGSNETLKANLARNGNDLEGSWRIVPGVKGQALEFDGYTTEVEREGKSVPALGNAFTVSAWVALNNYPWNWLPVVDQSEFRQVGFSLEIDAFGHVRLGASIDGVWKEVTSEETLPLKRWVHITGVWNGDSGLTVLIGGKTAGHLGTTGNFWQARDTSLMIGRVRTPQNTFPAWISRPEELSYYSLDGYVDEVSLAGRAITEKEDRRLVASVPTPQGDVIPYALLPSGPPGAGPFGAMYASLKYEPSWDRLRRIGADSDVVVRFSQSPMRLVFWQGTNYIPAWVTENGKWYTDEFLETWGKGCPGAGDCEPMSDKQSRYSHVSILASSDARAVIHWRYALSEARNYEGGLADLRTGWFDWADEYWTVYPDGVAVRRQVLHSSALDVTHEWQETIIIHGQGQRPEDNIEPDALTLENMAGETATYHWELKTDHAFALPKGPAKLDKPEGANIQIVHLKSAQNPFQIVAPKGVSFDTYNFEPSYATFEWWDHWPVAQLVSSGRVAVTADRASHSSLSHIYWPAYERTADTMTKLLMDGLTARDGAAANLLPLARSWTSPPEAHLREAGAGTLEYDPAQRAFVMNRLGDTGNGSFAVEIESSAEHPVVNPALVIENWKATGDGQPQVRVTVDGKALQVPAHFGIEHHLAGDDAVIYLEMTAKRPVEVEVKSAGR